MARISSVRNGALTVLHAVILFIFEFQRAKCGLGNYAMKQNLSVAVSDVKMPSFLPLEDIIKMIKANTEYEPCKVEGVKLLSSQTSLAKIVIEMLL